ncbi:MAG TPA: SDR family NAD(P)-dependent oxidoreductase, partial [Oceanipulchritudo sp.]|nr:SDR family NAD(P)-dependent oxidoreductase [Oceanipulchritudo sp.]
MAHKRALVTGANRGIGKAIAAGLAEIDDMEVLLGSRILSHGQAVAAGMGSNVTAVELDLENRETMGSQVQAILAAHGPIDILVNNAGILEDGSLLEVPDTDFDASLRVNLVAPFDLIRLLAPGMVARGYGRIVNLSSGWGSFSEGLGGPVSYAVSKAALNALTVKAAKDLSGNVKVNSMCPGWVKTDMGGPNAERSPEQGADTAIWLATLPDDGPTGKF